jgi:hypothetical protein
MSNIILSSNNNSALIQSLNESESRVIPSIYSTKEIYAPYSTNWYTIDSSSGNTGDGQAVNFDLPKYGFLQQMLFSYTKNIVNDSTSGTPDTALHKTPTGDIFNVIDRVELLSSSRILLTKYSEDLIAEFSALSSDQLYAISATAIKEGAAAAAGTTNSIKFVIPLTFFFDLNTMPNLSFNEPMSLRITFRDTKQYSVARTVGSNAPVVSVSNPQLMLRYKMYDEADTAQVLSNNYDSEQLNQLIRRQYRENPQSHAHTGTETTHTFEIILRNVDVVNEFYALVRSKPTTPVAGAESDAKVNELAEIQELTLTASGQELCKLTKEQLLYMSLTENGYQTNNSNLSTEDGVKLLNVNKIQTGLWCHGTGSGKWSNGWSLREMNNVVLSIKCTVAANNTYTCYVQETTSAIMSTSSATGRCAIALAN